MVTPLITMFYSVICEIREKWQKKKKKSPNAEFYILTSLSLFFLPFKKNVQFVKRMNRNHEYDRPSMSHWLIFKGKEL